MSTWHFTNFDFPITSVSHLRCLIGDAFRHSALFVCFYYFYDFFAALCPREYLLDKGVKLDLFKKETPRSDKIILVKNLPSGALPSELRAKFERYGALGRVVMPPSGVSALVEFSGSINAKKAFKGVTHSRLGPLHSSILYLEWVNNLDILHVLLLSMACIETARRILFSTHVIFDIGT